MKKLTTEVGSIASFCGGLN